MGPLIGAAVFLFVWMFVGGSAGTAFLVIIVVFVVVGMIFQNNKKNELKSRFENELTDFDPDHSLILEGSELDFPVGGIAISAEKKKLAIWELARDSLEHPDQPEHLLKIYDAAQVLELKVEVNQEVVRTTASHGGLGRAAIGGLLFGGAGAIVGAATASNVGTETNSIHTVSIAILLDSVDEALVHFQVFGLPDGAAPEDFQDSAVAAVADANFMCSLWELLQQNIVVARGTSRERFENAMRIFKSKSKNTSGAEEQQELLKGLLARASGEVASNKSEADKRRSEG